MIKRIGWEIEFAKRRGFFVWIGRNLGITAFRKGERDVYSGGDSGGWL